MSRLYIIRLFRTPKDADHLLPQSKQTTPNDECLSTNQEIPNNQDSKVLEHMRDVQANYFLERRPFL